MTVLCGVDVKQPSTASKEWRRIRKLLAHDEIDQLKTASSPPNFCYFSHFLALLVFLCSLSSMLPDHISRYEVLLWLGEKSLIFLEKAVGVKAFTRMMCILGTDCPPSKFVPTITGSNQLHSIKFHVYSWLRRQTIETCHGKNFLYSLLYAAVLWDATRAPF